MIAISCQKLKTIPSKLDVRQIKLSFLPNLVAKPKAYPYLINLILERIPIDEKTLEDIGRCEKLNYLDINQCNGLEEIPDYIGNCHNLEKICIRECHNLKWLSDKISECSKLKTISIIGCEKLVALP